MHSYLFIIGLSVLAQLGAAILALRLVRVTGQLASWVLIAGALVLMAGRRILVFFRWYYGVPSPSPDIPYEMVGLAVSLLMAVGIAWIGPLIRSLKESDRAIRESELKYRGVFESVGDAIFLLERGSGAILDANSVACALYGYSRGELLALRRVDLSAVREAAAVSEEALLPAVPPGYHRRKDGTTFPVEIAETSFDRDGRRFVLLSVRDISERIGLREKELRAERVMAVGRMAGGVAHRLNNMMTAVTGYSSLLLQRLAPGDPREREIRQILDAGRRAAGLTRQLLAIGRRQMLLSKEVDLPAFVAEAEPALRAAAGDGIAVEIVATGEPLRVSIDPDQLRKTLESLVDNARDAGADRVTIRVAPVALADGEVRGEEFTVAAGRYARVSVEDTGRGMDAEGRSRLFSPFFTTKEGGEGLDLASAYGFIKQSGGYVVADSELGRGTTFTIYFPRIEGAAGARREGAPAGPPPDPGKPAPGGGVPGPGRERILVMDDEDIVREVAGSMLNHLGYDVLHARDGEEAIALYKMASGTDHPVGAVILDLTVPGGMGGAETLRRLREFDPGVRAVVSSGYSDDPVMDAYRAHGFCAVVPKPYRILDLQEALRVALSGDGEPPTPPGESRVSA